LRAQMMGDVQRQTGQNVAQYSASGYDQAAQNMFQDRMNAANVGFGRLGAMTPGFTPTTQTQLGTQTQESPNSLWPQLLGAGLTVGGALLGGPAGAAAGGSLGGMISNPQGRMAQGGGLNWGGMGMQPNLGFGGYQPQGGMNWGSLGPWGRRVR
jgi:hypothetical protein